MMQAIRVKDDQAQAAGQLPPLEIVDVPKPSVKPDEVLIKVYACGINRADLVQRSGGYPPPPGASEFMGLECSGEIVDKGDAVPAQSYLKPGRAVCALLAGGGYAQYVSVPWVQVAPIPHNTDIKVAAGVMETFATAWLNLVMKAGMEKGDVVLIHAAASGVGTAAVQIAQHLGCTALGTASHPDKCRAVEELGAARCYSRLQEDMFSQIKSENPSVNVILDAVGSSHFKGNFDCIAVDGRWVIIGLMGGSVVEFPLHQLLLKRVSLIGSTIRARTSAFKGEVINQLRTELWDIIGTDTMRVIIDSEFDFADVEKAHARMASNASTGKILLLSPA